MYIDTHTHIYLPEFEHDTGSTIFRAKQSGVKKILLPNIDTGTIKKLLEFTASYPSIFHAMMGLHPGSVDDNYIKNLEITEKYLNEYSFIGVGEIGLDYYWDKTFIKEQKDAFITQCKWASEKKLPVSIHSRSATTEAIELIQKMSNPPHGIFHCFSGNISEAKEVIKSGFKLGIGGVATFKNSKLRNVLKQIEPENIVLETDAPYLTPHPYRGKRNEPSYLKLISSELASVYNMPESEISKITSKTACEVFNIKFD